MKEDIPRLSAWPWMAAQAHPFGFTLDQTLTSITNGAMTAYWSQLHPNEFKNL